LTASQGIKTHKAILDRIVEVKRREVAERKKTTPLAALEGTIGRNRGHVPEAQRDRNVSPEPMPPRDFRAALSGGGCAIIAEVKRRSPSRGVLREDFDPVLIAREYERHGAAAVSVLTDETFFGGSREDLSAVKGAVSLPVLRKEFIIDPWQIHETWAIGADALLLIAAILGENELREFRELAASLGLASLVEVHDRTELETALLSGAEIIGINNRDLRTFVTDLRTSLDLAPLIPSDRIAVSESGIRSRQEIELLMQAGIEAFLIGEALVAAPVIGTTLRGFLGR
jgi:indole-3-glycerol phosphate synthase